MTRGRKYLTTLLVIAGGAFLLFFWHFELIRIAFLSIRVYDLVDILAVAFIIYKLYQIFRGTRAAQMATGIIVLLLISVAAKLAELNGVTWLMSNLSTVWVIAFVIIFQPELRRILIYLGQNPIIRSILRVREQSVVTEIVEALLQCQTNGWGALIVLEREVGLRHLKERAVPIRAPVNAELLVSIFNPTSPLHDGAVIINHDMIEVAKAILPLSEEPVGARLRLGTRHLAALGLSEESDALILVLSEGTGTLSYAFDGVLKRGLDEVALRVVIEKYL